MALAMNIYQQFLVTLINKEIDLDSDTVKVMLLNTTYVPSINHKYTTDLSGEISGNGYTAGGVGLANKVFSVVSGVGTFDADNALWSNLTADNIKYAVLYDDTPQTNKPLIAYITYDTAQSAEGADFEIVWNSHGIIKLNI